MLGILFFIFASCEPLRSAARQRIVFCIYTRCSKFKSPLHFQSGERYIKFIFWNLSLLFCPSKSAKVTSLVTEKSQRNLYRVSRDNRDFAFFEFKRTLSQPRRHLRSHLAMQRLSSEATIFSDMMMR